MAVQSNSILLGDCVEKLQEVEDETVDFVLFSPPYDKMRPFNQQPLNLLQLGYECHRICKDGAVCAVVMNDQTVDGYKTLTTARLAISWVDEVGWKVFETGIYRRDGRPGGYYKKRFRIDHEYVLLFVKRKYPAQHPKCFDKSHLMVPKKTKNIPLSGGWRKRNGEVKRTAPITPKLMVKCRGTVWDYQPSARADKGAANRIKFKNSATFPDKLAADLIQCFSKEGELVIDPTMGSGTTLAMAYRYDRDFIGIDIDPKSCEIAKERVKREEVRKLMQTNAQVKPIRQVVWI